MKTLLVLLGPTGVGKTALSLRLAERLGCPVVNADSRQIYKDIPIGTAAPTAEERRRARHFFVGTHRLADYYSAAQYERECLALLGRLFKERDVCLLSGGSMMYIDAVCYGIDEIPSIDRETRETLRARYEAEGLKRLAGELRLLDPEYHARCDLRNPKRVVHALEVCYMTGRPFSSFHTGRKAARPFRVVRVGLERERGELFARINRRVDEMMEAGLLAEAERVLPHRHCNSLNTVGYKELFKYLDGEWTLDFALEKIRRNTRVYAKKQLTWFKKDPATLWLHPDAACDALLPLAGTGG